MSSNTLGRDLCAAIMAMSDKERERLEALEAVARTFLAKVEAGQAHSVVTYRALKAALAIGRESGSSTP